MTKSEGGGQFALASPTPNFGGLDLRILRLLYFELRVRCRRKDSSRSLSHPLMSFLLSAFMQTLESSWFIIVTYPLC